MRVLVGIIIFVLQIGGERAFAKNCIKEPAIELTDYNGVLISSSWYLEVIGADFAKQFTSKNKSAEISAGILDGGVTKNFNPSRCKLSVTSLQASGSFSNNLHAELVSQFMNGRFGSANSINRFHEIVHTEFRTGGDFESEINQAVSAGMRVLNTSMQRGLLYKENLVSYAKDYLNNLKLSKKGIILVTAAGNYGEHYNEVFVDKKTYPGIVVGAVTPVGNVWSNSQIGENVQIYAPGHILYNYALIPNEPISSGTSFSSPLVAGSIVNALEIFPDLNAEQVEDLMLKTSNQLPPDTRNGDQKINLINSFKLVKVVKRLKDLAVQRGIKGAKQMEQFINGELKVPTLHDFDHEGEKLFKIASTLEESKDCKKLWAAIDTYRESFLLTGSEKSRKKLIEMYKKVGHAGNALFFSNLGNQEQARN